MSTNIRFGSIVASIFIVLATACSSGSKQETQARTVERSWNTGLAPATICKFSYGVTPKFLHDSGPPDGRISMPLVEDMQAVGKTPTELSRDLEETLSEYIKAPKVNVIVTSFVGTFSEQIRVVGMATEPRALSYRHNMTLLDVMIEVGGLAEGAAGNRAKIIRRRGDQEVEIPVRINDLLNKGKISANIEILPGDVLIIPQSLF